jgi:hypothetical protein
MSTGADSLKSILFALGANFLIAVAKTAGRGVHRVVVDARRGDPFVRRLLEPGAAALGHARGQARAEPRSIRSAAARRSTSGASSSP